MALGSETCIFTDSRLAKEFEELELSECAETEHGVVKGGDLLDGDLAAGRSVDGRADDAVRALSDDIENLVLCTCMAASMTTVRRRSAGKYAPTLKRTFRGAGCAWDAA